MEQSIVSLALLGLTLLEPASATGAVSFDVVFQVKPLASETMSLTDRYPDPWVNEVFSDNIILALHYLKGDEDKVKDTKTGEVNWEKVRQPFEAEFTLEPGEVFAFHSEVLPEFKGKVVKTINARFNWDEGFKSDGLLVGDGVCHLASIMNWVASEANLKVVALANHDFRPVPGIDRKYGTAVFWGNQTQNLYIENTFDYPIKFTFKVDTDKINLSVAKF